jgi:hypothetical protein
LTVEEVAQLFSAEVTNWSDVNPAWPAEPVKRFSPGTDSGTFDYFIEAVMDPPSRSGRGSAAERGEPPACRRMTTCWCRAWRATKYAIGYFGFAYFEENAASLRDLAINGVEPTVETVNAGEYALARPLFIYSDAGVMASKPQVADYINFYLTNVNEEVIATSATSRPRRMRLTRPGRTGSTPMGSNVRVSRNKYEIDGKEQRGATAHAPSPSLAEKDVFMQSEIGRTPIATCWPLHRQGNRSTPATCGGWGET